MQQHFRHYLLLNIGIILGSFVIFGAISLLLSQALSAKADQIASDRTAISKRAGDLESLSNLKARASEAEALQKKIDLLLPPQDSLISFPQFMNSAARNYSLGLNFNFSSAPVPPAGNTPGYVAFDSTFEGSPENIRGVINYLEHGTTKFLISLEEVSFTPQASAYRADIRGQVFFRENDI